MSLHDADRREHNISPCVAPIIWVERCREKPGVLLYSFSVNFMYTIFTVVLMQFCFSQQLHETIPMLQNVISNLKGNFKRLSIKDV